MAMHGIRLGLLMDRVDGAGREGFQVLPTASTQLIRHVSSPAAFLLAASEPSAADGFCRSTNGSLPTFVLSDPCSDVVKPEPDATAHAPGPAPLLQLPGLPGSHRAASSDIRMQLRVPSVLLCNLAGCIDTPGTVSAAAPGRSLSQPQPLSTHPFLFQGEPGSPAISEELCFQIASANAQSGGGAGWHGSGGAAAAAPTRAAPLSMFPANTAVAAANASSSCSSTAGLPFTMTTTATTLMPPGDVNTDEMLEELFREQEQEAAAALQLQQRQMQQAAANLRSALTQQQQERTEQYQQQQQRQQQRVQRSVSGNVDGNFEGALTFAGMHSTAGAAAAANTNATGGVCSSAWSWLSPASEDGAGTHNSNSSNLLSMGPASGAFAGADAAGALALQFDITRLALSGGGSLPGSRPASAPDMQLPLWSPRVAAAAEPGVASATHAQCNWADAGDLLTGAPLEEPTLAPAALGALIAEVGGGGGSGGGSDAGCAVGAGGGGGGGMLVLDTEHGGGGAGVGAGGAALGALAAGTVRACAFSAPVARVTRAEADAPAGTEPNTTGAVGSPPAFIAAAPAAAILSPSGRSARGSSSGRAAAAVASVAAATEQRNAAHNSDEDNGNLGNVKSARHAGATDAMDVDCGGCTPRARTRPRSGAQLALLPPLAPRPNSGPSSSLAAAAAATKPANPAAAAHGGSAAPASDPSSGSVSGSRGVSGSQGFVAAAMPLVKLEETTAGSGAVGWVGCAAEAAGGIAVKGEELEAEFASGDDGGNDAALNTLLAARFKRKPGRVPKVLAKLGPIAALAKNAVAGKLQLPKEQLRELVVTVESSLAQAQTEAKEDSRARNRLAQQRFRSRQKEAIAALQAKVEEQEDVIAQLQNRIKLHEQRAGLAQQQPR